MLYYKDLFALVQVMEPQASMLGVLPQDQAVTGCQLDSRAIREGDLFVAFEGARVDGHDYLDSAQNLGAVCALVTKFTKSTITQIRVKDPMAMLVHIARTVRGLWPKNRTVIALTGSVGKTTTKDLCASIFSQVGHTYQTQGNQNNLLGVSLTIMNVPKTCQYAIIELGINARFEMITLAELVRPDIALITNIGPCHLEKLGSLAGVAEQKANIYKGLCPGGIAVLPENTPYESIFTQAAGKARRVYYGQDGEHAPIKMYDLKLDGQSFAQFTLAADGNAQSCSLQIIGGHQVNNALAAATCALELGVDLPHIVRGLEEYKGAKNRLQLIESGYAGATVLMDAYNANPLSLEKALETIGYFGKREKCLVLGDMGELGEESVKWHEQAAGLAMQYGVNRLLTVGKLSQHAQKQFQGYGQHYETVESLQEALRDHLHNDMVVLIKGSRSMQLEKLTEVVLDKQGA